MMKEKLSLGKALLAVKEKRPEAAPKAAFIEQLRALEGRLNIAPASPRTAEAAGTQVTAEREVVNPQVFFEIALDGEPAGRIEMELFADRVPKTAENFRCLCTGEKGRGPSGKRLNFLGSIFHRVVPGLVCAGGDFTMGNGTGGESIYGQDFEDENFDVKHDAPGILSMANTGPSTNGSQFVICLQPVAHLDGRNVAFGRVVSGYEVVQKMEACGTTEKEFEEEEEAKKEGEEKEVNAGVPTKRITIMDCGEVQQTGKRVKRPRISESEVVRVLHILRKHGGCKKPTSWREEKITCSKDQAIECLDGLRKQLVSLSKDASKLRPKFEEFACTQSDCKSAKKGGDLGPFERGMMQKPFEAAAFALQVGELSEVVSTKLGEHLILRVA